MAQNSAAKADGPQQEEPTQAPGTALATMDYGTDAGAGMENVTADELAIPFFRMLQGLSPQVNPAEAKYIEGAKQGEILNTATGEHFPVMDFVAVHRDHNFGEYTPREQGGGFIGIKAPDDPEVLSLRAKQGKFGKLITARDTHLVETFSLFGIAVIGGRASRGVISFASTAIKAYTGFITQVSGIEYPNSKGDLQRPPLWAHRWRISSKPDKNKKGSFFSWKIEPAEPRVDGQFPFIKSRMNPDAGLYIAGKEFYEMIKAGKVTVKREDAAVDEDADKDIPF